MSAIAKGNCYATRNDWIHAVTSLFSDKDDQHVELRDLQVTPPASNIALLTSQDRTDMRFADGEKASYNHCFTIVWEKGHQGWQIVHSHESWVDATVS